MIKDAIWVYTTQDVFGVLREAIVDKSGTIHISLIYIKRCSHLKWSGRDI